MHPPRVVVSNLRGALVAAVTVALLVQLVAVVNAQTAECDMSQDLNQALVISAGQMFSIALESQPGTGYSWTLSQPPDPAIVEPVSSTTLPAAIPRPGAPETQCFVFTAVGAGETRMQFQYARPFETDTPPARVKDVQVVVSTGVPSVPVQMPESD